MLGILFVLLAGLLWAIDTLIRYPLVYSGIDVGKIIFAEHLILTIIFLPYVFKTREKFLKMRASSYFYILFVGVLGSALATYSFTKAFALINPSLVILLQKLQPVVAITLARVFLREKMKPLFYFWAAIALFGGFLISSPDILPGLGHLDFNAGLLSQQAILGYLLTFLAVISWGASTVFGKKLSYQNFDEKQIMGSRYLTGFIAISVYLYLTTGTLALNWSGDLYLKIIGLVVLSGLLGMYMFYRGLKIISARACAIAEMFFPFSAVLINWIFLDAKLLPIQIVGAGLLVLSSSIIQYKKY